MESETGSVTVSITDVNEAPVFNPTSYCISISSSAGSGSNTYTNMFVRENHCDQMIRNGLSPQENAEVDKAVVVAIFYILQILMNAS